ncbi:Hypothetical protein PFR_JS21-2_1960 [Propionibacterium freudenreichii]|nr:Hypothetical protein PFR_JS4_1648 [Propionibacterium freudenreichii]SCQ57491.1 Hypothetical protein PFR_JS21-1_1961 [Propionibacterium freudenreichii]SCQ60957.1 Hypothetical protein PFR_JS25-1_1814 [Propionibacterium freudenreichii]SCQ65223.1 Hypothetical protein PFR_JS21-2_1960 [Propionibacterium freudenreichii]
MSELDFYQLLDGLNEGPLQKEGQCEPIDIARKVSEKASMKGPSRRRGNRHHVITRPMTCSHGLNEGPLQKEGQSLLIVFLLEL